MYRKRVYIMNEKFFIGKGSQSVFLLPSMANRHGVIAGATGTGKTISLKVLAEYFSDAGVPVFLSDVKGDLASLAQAGEPNEKISERLEFLGVEGFDFKAFPVRCWDVYGELGHPLRTSISEMGPILLSRILNLNDVQSGVLNIVFRVADDMGLLLIDLKDLRSMVQYVGENAKEYQMEYGSIASATIGAIQRSLLLLEDAGGHHFFAEPAIDIEDLLQVDVYNKGFINVLASQKLMHSPSLYSTFLLYLLSELYESLPEVGDLDKPKLVFFFDEAHLLFDQAPKVLLDKIELVVRLIRSKGVGVYFITQNPIDIPDKVLAQLGNRIQHALRAYTPKEKKSVTAMAETFRLNPEIDIVQEITELKTGEALVSFLNEQGKPNVVEKVMIVPPKSKIGVVDSLVRESLIKNSPYYYKYHQIVDKESAYEILKEKVLQQKQEQDKLQQLKAEEELLKQQQKLDRAKEKATGKKPTNDLQRMAKSFLTTMSSSVGRELARGVFGSLRRK